MRIVNPQDAVLTNIEVLAYLTANPPRRPPNPPPNSRHWIPCPDLRDHNTVVKEIHNYATRLSPHLLNYPQYTATPNGQPLPPQDATPNNASYSNNAPAPIDDALRSLVTRLQPFGLTKGEVVMIVNLGIGLDGPAETQQQEEEEEDADGMDVDNSGGGGDALDGEGGGEGGAEEEGEGGDDEAAMARDYGALALLDTVIEEREERLSQEDVSSVLAIIRETLGRR